MEISNAYKTLIYPTANNQRITHTHTQMWRKKTVDILNSYSKNILYMHTIAHTIVYTVLPYLLILAHSRIYILVENSSVKTTAAKKCDAAAELAYL